MHLINNFASTQEKKKLYDIFKVLDLDGNGVLSKEEILKGYEAHKG